MKIGHFLDKEIASISSYLSNKSRLETESYNRIIKNPFYFIVRRLTSQKLRNFLSKFISQYLLFSKEKVFDLKNWISWKNFAIDYFFYMERNRDKEVPLSIFPKQDRKVLINFLKTYLWFTFFERMPNHTFWKKNLEIFEKSRNLYDQIKVKNGYFEINGIKIVNVLFEGFTYYFPLSRFKRKKEIIFDLGAYSGDTALVFNKIKHPKKIYAFEPDPDNMKILKENIRLNHLESTVIPVSLAASDKNGYVYFEKQGPGSAITEERKQKNIIRVKTTTIDDFVQKEKIKKVDLIKMDIEGAEFDALKGAVKTLKRDKPDLLIAIYHKGEHLFEIPPWLKKLVPEYNLRFLAFNQASPIIERFVGASVKWV